MVQKMLNHAKSADTLRYIGLGLEKLDCACLDLNLVLQARPRRR